MRMNTDGAYQIGEQKRPKNSTAKKTRIIAPKTVICLELSPMTKRTSFRRQIGIFFELRGFGWRRNDHNVFVLFVIFSVAHCFLILAHYVLLWKIAIGEHT